MSSTGMYSDWEQVNIFHSKHCNQKYVLGCDYTNLQRNLFQFKVLSVRISCLK